MNINFIDADHNDDHASDIQIWIDDTLEEFADSIYFEQLNKNEQDACGFLLQTFFTYCYDYCLIGPGKLNRQVIEEIMLDVMPRKISADRSTFEAFAPVMDKFLYWCEENKYMKNMVNIRNYINSISSKMINYSDNPQNWGMAKSIVMGGGFNHTRIDNALKQIANIQNNDNMINSNQQIRNGTYQRETAKIGRNNVCHCGSGKKYKKCCLIKTCG